jgi:hypothetical protein
MILTFKWNRLQAWAALEYLDEVLGRLFDYMLLPDLLLLLLLPDRHPALLSAFCYVLLKEVSPMCVSCCPQLLSWPLSFDLSFICATGVGSSGVP